MLIVIPYPNDEKFRKMQLEFNLESDKLIECTQGDGPFARHENDSLEEQLASSTRASRWLIRRIKEELRPLHAYLVKHVLENICPLVFIHIQD